MRMAMIRALRVGSLVVVALLAFSRPGQTQCTVPSQYTNTISSTAGDLNFVMGTDRSYYTLGDPVQFWLSVYNSGPATVVIPNPYQVSAIHSWDVLPDSCESYYQPEGCQYDAPYHWPQGIFFFGVPMPVAPGQCKTFTVTWDGVHQWSALGHTVIPATYKVIGGFLVGDSYTTSQGAALPAMEVHIQISQEVPNVPVTWSTIKARFD